VNIYTMSLRDPGGVDGGLFWISSQYKVFLCGKKILMNVLMSFYEDRDEEGEENIEVKEEGGGLCLCLRA